MLYFVVVLQLQFDSNLRKRIKQNNILKYEKRRFG